MNAPEVLPRPPRLLLVDDDPDDRMLVRRALSQSHPGAQFVEVNSETALVGAVEAGGFDLAITDFQLRWSDGLAVLRLLRARHPGLPVIMFTGTGSEEIAVEALQGGLDDYVLKSPRHLVRLAASVRACLDRARERRHAQDAQETLHALKKAVDTLGVGVSVVDARGTLVYANPAHAVLQGAASEAPTALEAVLAEASPRTRPWRREATHQRGDGTSFPVELVSEVVRDPAGLPTGFVTICEDITERKHMEEQLRRNAFFDALTGLPNRTLFLDRLHQALDRARRRADSLFAVLFLDLDRFKLVNDSYGHGVGDDLLRETALRLERGLRPSDTVARLGGDEFAILADEIADARDAVQIALRTQAQLVQAMHAGGHELFTSASIGIALVTPTYADPESILRDADTAMYRAKARGRARYEVFGAEMLDDVRGLLRLETELRRALDRGEFRVHYQPIVSLSTGRVLGAEALLRWQHPEHGLLTPASFLAVAEEAGLIGAIGEWVLHEACVCARGWAGGSLAGVRVGVNLSPRQFRSGSALRQVRRALDASGLPPHLLDVELTEGTLMEGGVDAVRSLEELRALGPRISVDDFGTGYSSLSYLKRFPVNTLKIDRSFVENLGHDTKDAAIAAAVVTLGHSLDLEVVAEGVESLEQADFLRRERCDAMQGYVYCHPLPAEELEIRMEAASSGGAP